MVPAPRARQALLEVPVRLERAQDRSYPILIEPGLLRRASEIIADRFPSTACAVISDSNLTGLYAGKIAAGLEEAGLRTPAVISFPAGEQSKNRRVKEQVEDRMFEAGLGRDSLVVAVGGGVVGDLAGFVAATYARGVPLVQVPTSLLAMADSSIGGKTGVDVPWGKNLIGAFHQPALVLIDPEVLITLDQRQFAAGMAEIVKHGVIRELELFDYLESSLEQLTRDNADLLADLVARNCRIKASVVQQDERETNLRQILNFGHTLGHAVEAFSGYRMLHGEAVACGMALEADIAVALGLLKAQGAARIAGLLTRLGLPVTLAGLAAPAERLIEMTTLDKKARKGRARYALPLEIGRMAASGDGSYGIEVPDEVVRNVLVARGATG